MKARLRPWSGLPIRFGFPRPGTLANCVEPQQITENCRRPSVHATRGNCPTTPKHDAEPGVQNKNNRNQFRPHGPHFSTTTNHEQMRQNTPIAYSGFDAAIIGGNRSPPHPLPDDARSSDRARQPCIPHGRSSCRTPDTPTHRGPSSAQVFRHSSWNSTRKSYGVSGLCV